MARKTIAKGFGQPVAAIALKPLDGTTVVRAELGALERLAKSRNWNLPYRDSPRLPRDTKTIEEEIDALLGVRPEPPAPEPTRGERRAYRSAIAEWMLTDPDLDALAQSLGALLRACKGDGAISATPSVSRAAQAVKTALGDALAQGYDQGCLQAVLDYWTEANDGSNIAVRFGSIAS